MRWVALSAAKNLIPKLSTARVKLVGRVVWVQRPGGVRHRSVAVGVEVADKALVGNDVGFL